MAGCDYRSCDVCGTKTFYDANLGWEHDHRDLGAFLPGLGDWAVICKECALTHECVVVKRKKQLVEVECPDKVQYCQAFHTQEAVYVESKEKPDAMLAAREKNPQEPKP